MPKKTSLILAHDANRLDQHLVAVLEPNSWEAERYRALRHVVGGHLRRTDAQGAEMAGDADKLASLVLGVTSPSPGDGKTTTAINLAASLSESPLLRVLLVDTDLRCSNMENALGLERDELPSFVDAIRDQHVRITDVVRRHPRLRFSVLPAGVAPHAPYELLESPRAGELLAEARELYNLIILDTPPLIAVTDTQALSQWVDRFIVVVAAHKTPRRLLGDTLSALAPEKVFGIVFNRDDARKGNSMFRKYYTRQRFSA